MSDASEPVTTPATRAARARDEHHRALPAKRELRLAPVMTGGTSLAVWMGGVTAEIFRLLVSDKQDSDDRLSSIYRGLLDLTHTTPTVDVITGWSREVPGTPDTDAFSIAWLTLHEEPGLSLRMLTFNFSYGEGASQLPPLSDELVFDWIRHYRPKFQEAAL